MAMTQAAVAALTGADYNCDDNDNEYMKEMEMRISKAYDKDPQIAQRLCWVKYTRNYPVQGNLKDLYWPSLQYPSHQQANKLSNDNGFQFAMWGHLMEIMVNNDGANDRPVAHLLGLGEDDDAYCDLLNCDDEKVLKFAHNMVECHVAPKSRDLFFDMNSEEDQEMWECYQFAFAEARTIMSVASQRRRLRGRIRKGPRTKARPEFFKKKGAQDSSKNNNSGGNNDDKGNDKPDNSANVAAGSLVAQDASNGTLVQAPWSENRSSTSGLPASSAQPATQQQQPERMETEETTNNEIASPASVQQETQQQMSAVENGTATTNNNQAMARAPTQQETAMVAVATAAPVTNSSLKPTRMLLSAKPGEPPVTPPFHLPEMRNVDPDMPYQRIWMKMRYHGWRVVSGVSFPGQVQGPAGDRVIKPGANVHTGVEGVDYFIGRSNCQAYVQSKIPHWRPPAWTGNNNNGAHVAQPVVRPAPAARANGMNNNNGNNRRAMSSSATVVTTDSPSSSRPPFVGPSKSASRERRSEAQAIPPARTSLRPRRASTKGGRYGHQASLGTQKVEKDRLWWQTKSVPAFSDVTPILLKLGIRRDENRKFELPKAVASSKTDDAAEIPELTSSAELRKYLCTKGIPRVPGSQIINEEECELLHQWVSIAYVPIDDLALELWQTELPNENKIRGLLGRFHFETMDNKYYPPFVNRAGLEPADRVPDIHVFHGLEHLRDYIRRTASFSWTADEFQVSDEDIDISPPDKALLRLWAASSPSPLPSYETSISEIKHMEQILPASSNVFETDSEEASVVDSEEAVDADSESSDESKPEEEDASSGPEMEESSPDTDNSDSDQSDEEASSSDSSNGSVESPLRVRVQAKAARKRKADAAFDDPWWKKEAPPSFRQMEPIVRKLGVRKNSSGIWVLPPAIRSNRVFGPSLTATADEPLKDELPVLDNSESLRQRLCSHGIPKYAKNDPKKPKERLTGSEKEMLRRWVSFAFFPAKRGKFLETVKKAEGPYNRFFSRNIEIHMIAPFIAAGFSRDAYGAGYYPPGIDKLGRERDVRRRHVMPSVAQVQSYVRSAAKLSYNVDIDDEQIHQMAGNRFLGLRLWGALDKSPLRTYDVKVGPVEDRGLGSPPVQRKADGKGKKGKNSPHSVGAKGKGRASSSPGKKDSKRKKGTHAPPKAPQWWKADTLDDRIHDLNQKIAHANKRQNSTRRRVPLSSTMSLENLLVAREFRSRVEADVLRLSDNESPKSFDEAIEEMASKCNLDDRDLKSFLTGGAMNYNVRNNEIMAALRARWPKEGEVDADALSEPPTKRARPNEGASSSGEVESSDSDEASEVSGPVQHRPNQEESTSSDGGNSDSDEVSEAPGPSQHSVLIPESDNESVADTNFVDSQVDSSPAAGPRGKGSLVIQVDDLRQNDTLSHVAVDPSSASVPASVSEEQSVQDASVAQSDGNVKSRANMAGQNESETAVETSNAAGMTSDSTNGHDEVRGNHTAIESSKTAGIETSDSSNGDDVAGEDSKGSSDEVADQNADDAFEAHVDASNDLLLTQADDSDAPKADVSSKEIPTQDDKDGADDGNETEVDASTNRHLTPEDKADKEIAATSIAVASSGRGKNSASEEKRGLMAFVEATESFMTENIDTGNEEEEKGSEPFIPNTPARFADHQEDILVRFPAQDNGSSTKAVDKESESPIPGTPVMQQSEDSDDEDLFGPGTEEIGLPFAPLTQPAED